MRRASGGSQIPAIYSQFFDVAYLGTVPAAPQPSPAPKPAPAPVTPAVSPQPERPIPANMVRIQGGTFTMGSPDSEAGRSNNETRRQVTVGSFYLGKYEVSQGDYESVMGTNPSRFKGANLLVEQVSWYDAVEYCNALSRKEGLSPAYTISVSGDSRNVSWNRAANGYRLPTEAEWEYACRAGTTTPYYSGGSVNNAGWFQANSRKKTHKVGSKKANAWGLYDMHGNVWEWCWDWYDGYSSGSETDSGGPGSGASRVGRGGSWINGASELRSASRLSDSPGLRIPILGLRLARP